MIVKELAVFRIILNSGETLLEGPLWHLWKFLLQRCSLFPVAIVLCALAGCVVIPTPEHGLLDGRGEIDESDIEFLEEGKTTREEVLLRFGEPDEVEHDNRTLLYHWQVICGYYVVGGGYQADGGPIPRHYKLMLEFDEEGRLKRFERNGSIWRAIKVNHGELTPSGSKKPPPIIMIDPIPEAPAQPSPIATSTGSVRFRVGEFCDSRTLPHAGTFVGNYKFWGIVLEEMRTTRPVSDIVRSVVARQLQAMGHQLVDKDADVIVTGAIAEFGVKKELNLLTAEAIGSLDVIVGAKLSEGTAEPVTHRYQAKHVAKTYYLLSEKHFNQVIHDCLEDMQRDIASDLGLAKLLR